MTESRSEVTADPAPIPERLGVYRIESLLGRGGMGEVFLAWDELLERHVAIKRVWSGRGPRRARFLREARAVARLDHPAIVRIYHVLERDDGDCLVMERIEGRELSALIRVDGLEPGRVAALGAEIAAGLAEAHVHGLVHRDLKAANVMVDTSVHVKILDFGIAK
ncbi:MAG: serine/threonine-protein kinase, partial [Acidobacteriota bacterium]